MIVGLLSDPLLRQALERGARPDEDVILGGDDVWDALERGFPRLVVRGPKTARPQACVSGAVPDLVLTDHTVKGWEVDWRASGLLMSRSDFSAGQLASLIRATARPVPWVDRLFRELATAIGGPLPDGFRGFARRILEYPARYAGQEDLAAISGLAGDALSARFRRRGLESPFLHLRWLRALVAAEVLADPDATVGRVAHCLGDSSTGNCCRSIELTCGLRPSDLRDGSMRAELRVRFAKEFLHPAALRGWDDLDEIFLTRSA